MFFQHFLPLNDIKTHAGAWHVIQYHFFYVIFLYIKCVFNQMLYKKTQRYTIVFLLQTSASIDYNCHLNIKFPIIKARRFTIISLSPSVEQPNGLNIAIIVHIYKTSQDALVFNSKKTSGKNRVPYLN